MSQLDFIPAELPQVHDILGMRVAGVVDNHRLDVAPFLAFADSNQLLPELSHLDLATPYDSRVLLRPWQFGLLLLDLFPDAVPARSMGIVPRPVRVVWHHPNVLVLWTFLPGVPKERSLFPRSPWQIVKREGELDVRNRRVGCGSGRYGAVYLC
jgi:hypothetical protein